MPSDEARGDKGGIMIIDQVIEAGEKGKRARNGESWWDPWICGCNG